MFIHRMLSFATLCALFAAHFAYAGTIDYQVTALPGGLPGQPLFQYTYYLSGFNFASWQEIDFVYAANLFGSLSNGAVTPGFEFSLFQPNNPPGATGDFNVMALTQLQAVDVSWSVDVTYLGSGLPGPQTFLVYQFNANGNLLQSLGSGQTDSPIPEPGTFVLAGLVAWGSVIWRAVRRRKAARPSAVLETF
jgi:hypothetical protein